MKIIRLLFLVIFTTSCSENRILQKKLHTLIEEKAQLLHSYYSPRKADTILNGYPTKQEITRKDSAIVQLKRKIDSLNKKKYWKNISFYLALLLPRCLGTSVFYFPIKVQTSSSSTSFDFFRFWILDKII